MGISKENSKKVCDLLNALVADEAVLYQKTRHFHWNVEGPFFHDLHLLFEEQYDQLAELIDELAERVRQLGRHSMGTLTEFLKFSRIKEHPGAYPSHQEMLKELLADHETLIRQLREDQKACSDDFQDDGTNDLLIGCLRKHEKFAWMIRALLSLKA